MLVSLISNLMILFDFEQSDLTYQVIAAKDRNHQSFVPRWALKWKEIVLDRQLGITVGT